MSNDISYTNLNIKDLPDSEVEISADIPYAFVEPYRKKALKKLSETAEIDGFRKGKVPEKMIIERLGEPKILEEAISDVLAAVYPKIILDNTLNVVGRPEISITKLAPGNPVSFTAKSAVMPEVKLPDYKNVAKTALEEKGAGDFLVTNEEIEKVMTSIRENKARIESGNDELPEKLPELTDDDVKKLGDFASLEDFQTKLRENLKKGKENDHKEAQRLAIADALIKESEIALPKLFVEAELDKLIAEFRSQIAATGMIFEDYLEKTEKTEEDVRTEARGEAERRAKLQLILNKIAEEEKIEPDSAKLEHEAMHIMEQYKDANPEQVRSYVGSLLQNQAVYEMLESSNE